MPLSTCRNGYGIGSAVARTGESGPLRDAPHELDLQLACRLAPICFTISKSPIRMGVELGMRGIVEGLDRKDNNVAVPEPITSVALDAFVEHVGRFHLPTGFRSWIHVLVPFLLAELARKAARASE